MRVFRPQDLEIVPEPPAVLRRRLSHARDLTVRVAGIVLRMRFEDESVRDKFAFRYRHHVSLDAPSLTYNCGAEAGTYYFWSETAAWCWPHGSLPVEALVVFVDATAMSTLVRSDPALLSFHAAAIGYRNAAAAIVGDSTAGKTTTTVACARRGMTVFSDERLMIREGTMVLPFLRAFNVRRHGALLLEQDNIDDAFGKHLSVRVPEKDWTDISPLEFMPHLHIPPPAPLRAVFLLDGKAQDAQILEVDAARSCPRLLSSLDCMARARLDRAARVLEILRQVRVFSVTLGRPDASAVAIESILSELCAHAA